MKLALDTNAYRALHEGDDALVVIVASVERLAVPIIVIGELRYGFMHGTRLRENTEALERFIAQPRIEILQVDDGTTHRYGDIFAQLRRAGTPIQQNDVWIAALCRQHGFTLATRDRDFHHVAGLSVLDVGQ